MAATIKSLPAPIGGWNARDSIADMPPTDAISLTNWFPLTTELQQRKGYTNWTTGLPGQVETLMAYAGAATDKLFAASVTGIYDCTAGGAVGAAAVTGMANARWQYINNATAGGNFLLAVNGADKMRYYDGTTWSADGGTFTVTVADTSNWIGITLHKQRVWGIAKNTLTAYYLPTAAIAGAASLFDMRQFFKLGGTLQGVETLTIDGGTGSDDHLAFISSKGEVLVYRGTDPSSIATWQMVGLYRIGTPVGNRCLFKYQGDLLAITQDGLFPMSKAFLSERVDPRIAVTDKIQQAVSDATSAYSTNFGWQIISFPKADQLWLNVPIGLGQQQQFVMNTNSKAWCNYAGWAANCWEIYKDNPYFGGNTVVGLAWNGYSDNGANIAANGLQAYNYYGSPKLKRFTMSRPVFRANGQPSIFAGYSLDFDATDTTAALSFTKGVSAGLWGSGLWGSMLWGGSSLSVYKSWQGAQGVGYAAAPRVKVTAQGFDIRWVSTDVIFERGAFL